MATMLQGSHMILTVASYLIQSSQNLLAENFFLIAMVDPLRKTWATPTMPPAEWYNGRVL